MKRLLFGVIFAAALLPLGAQNSGRDMESVLRRIESNNLTLRALSEQAEADKLAHRVGISLPDPEVEFARLWGAPTAVGNRTDVAVTQGFDLATITGMRARQGRRRGELVDHRFASERIGILTEAKECLIELVYYNRLARELQTRLGHARTLAEGYAERLARGDANRLEYTRAQLALAGAEGELARVEIERRALQDELRRLNGGVEITFDDTDFRPVALPADFESWYAEVEGKSPVLEYVRCEAEADRREVSLAAVEGLPAFSVGYMRERTLGQRYEGVKVGVSVPLFGNRNRVRQARAAHTAAETRERDTRVQFREQMRGLYSRAAGLEKTAARYRLAVEGWGNGDLFKRALDAGRISLLEYVVELGLYYDLVDRWLAAERDYRLAHTSLTAVEL